MKRSTLSHNKGQSSYPFKKVGVDLFEINDKYFLATVDYFCNYSEIDVTSLVEEF